MCENMSAIICLTLRENNGIIVMINEVRFDIHVTINNTPSDLICLCKHLQLPSYNPTQTSHCGNPVNTMQESQQFAF